MWTIRTILCGHFGRLARGWLTRFLVAFGLLLTSGLVDTSKAVAAGPSSAVCRQIYEQFGVQGVGCASVSLGLGALENAVQNGVALEPADVVQARRKESHILFPNGGSGLDPAALAQIALLARVLQTPIMQGACLRLVGHSDSVGPADVNQTLSEARARGVADQLRPLLRRPFRIENVSGLGETRPLPDTDPAAAENRRVEIWLRSCLQ